MNNPYSIVTKVRPFQFWLKLNSAFTESRRGNCHDNLPILSAPVGVHVSIYHCPIIVDICFFFCKLLVCKASYVRGGMVYKGMLDGLILETTFVSERSPFVHKVYSCRPLFRPLWANRMPFFLENFYAHVALTQHDCCMLWANLHWAWSSRHFPDTLSLRHRTTPLPCQILFRCFWTSSLSAMLDSELRSCSAKTCRRDRIILTRLFQFTAQPVKLRYLGSNRQAFALAPMSINSSSAILLFFVNFQMMKLMNRTNFCSGRSGRRPEAPGVASVSKTALANEFSKTTVRTFMFDRKRQQ